MFLGRCGRTGGTLGRDLRKERLLDSDHSASGTFRVGLGKLFHWVRGVLLSRKSSLGLEYGRDQIKEV